MKIDQLSFYYSNELEEAMKRHSEVLERKKKAMNKLQIPLFSILAEEALDDALYQMDQDKIFDWKNSQNFKIQQSSNLVWNFLIGIFG